MKALQPRVILILLLALLLGACASGGWPYARVSLKAGAPATATAAELFLLGNARPDRAAREAEALLLDSRATEAQRARAFAVLVVASEIMGEFERSLPFVAERLKSAVNPGEAFNAAASLSRVWGRLDGARPDDAVILEAIATAPWRGRAGFAEASFELDRQSIAASLLAKGIQSERQATAAAGFLTEWRISAPWGHTPSLDLAPRQGPETRALAPIEKPGTEWKDELKTSQEIFSDGEVLIFDLDGRAGLGFAEASIPSGLTGSGQVLVAIETNRLAQVFVADQGILERSDSYSSTFATTVIAAPAAGARVTVKFASPDGRGFFRLALRPHLQETGGPAPFATILFQPQKNLGPADPAAVVQAILQFQRLIERPYRDPVRAQQVLDAVAETLKESPVVTWMRFRLAYIDVDAGWGRRRETLRNHLDVLTRAWPDIAVFKRDLARIEREEQRAEVALGLLTSDDPRTRLERLEVLRERGWEAPALELIAELLAALPESPRVAQEAIDTYNVFGRIEAALALATKLEARWPGFGAGRLAALYLDAGRAQDAAALADGLYKARPQRHADLRATVEALRVAGDLPGAHAALTSFLLARPADLWALAERVRLELGCALPLTTPRPACDALAGYTAALLAEAPSHAPVRSLAALIAGQAESFDSRAADGAARLAEARRGALAAESPLLAFPVVTVLDRILTEVLADGGTTELTHRLRQANTRQGADALGDIRVPAGARLLIARTIKADGRIVYPEITPGKTDISLSELKPGDAVETAWVTHSRVEPEEGGYLTSIGFAHIGVPILAIERDFQLPPSLDLDITLRHGAPAAQKTTTSEGGRLYTWRFNPEPARDFWPREPGAVSARAFTPYADLRVIRPLALLHSPGDLVTQREASLLVIARAYAERLRSLGARGPRLQAQVKALRRAAKGSGLDYAAYAADWVRENIEATETDNQFESSVEKALGTGRGNRALVLLGLLQASDAAPSLLLCAPEREGALPDADSPLPNANRYYFPIVSHAGRLYDVSRLHTDPTALPAELRGVGCLDPLTSERGVLAMTRIPDGVAAEKSFQLKVIVQLDARGDAEVELQGVFQGPNAAGIRQVWVKQDEVRRRLIWEQWLSGIWQGATLTSADVRGAASARDPMRTKLTFALPGFARLEGDTLVIPRLSDRALLASDFTNTPELLDLVSLSSRRTPLRVPSHDEEVLWVIKAPPGFVATDRDAEAPAEETSVLGLASFRDSEALKDGGARIELTRVSLLRPGAVQPNESYGAFREALNKTAAARARPVAFRKKR